MARSSGEAEGRGHTALVTGASSGIGREIAVLLGSRGYDVVLVARRAEMLERLAREIEQTSGVNALPLPVDLVNPTACETIATALDDQHLTVDFLVNNAGYAMFGTYASTTWQQKQDFLQVMGIVPLELTDRLLPAMLQRGWGRIVNIASISALMTSTPQMVLYAATKSLLVRFSEGIAEEYADQGINCTVSLPGITDTELAASSGTTSFIEGSRLAQLVMMDAGDVARDAYEAVMSGRRMTIPGRHNKALATVLNHAPHPVRRKVSSAITSPIYRDDLRDAE